MTMTKSMSVLALALIGGAGVSAQTATANKPRFEVASVKSSAPDQPGQSMRRTPGGRLTITNTPLREIVAAAYGVLDAPWQLDGLPGWAASERFDVVAKAPGDVPPVRPGTPDPLLLMLRPLLQERFKLAAHSENRDMPIYALVAVKPGVLGPDLRRSTVDCAALRATPGRADGPPPPPAVGADGRPLCGLRGVPPAGPGAPGGLQGGNIPLSQLANVILPRFVSRTIVDRTGLDGFFDFQLLFSPPAAPDQSGGSVFTALQEQLGLKLESTRAPVEVWVVDHVERPTPD
jgi:uncharacterized protein (TIGR03435 family)